MSPIGRKSIHILFGIGIILTLIHLEEQAKPLFMIFLAIGIITSIVAKRTTIPIISSALDRFDKKEHRHTFPGKGANLFLASATALSFIVPDQITLASITILTFGDSTSFLIGRYFGKNKIPYEKKKNIEGTIAGIIAASLTSSLFVPTTAAIAASLIAMFVESLPHSIDDNISIPITAAIVLTVLL